MRTTTMDHDELVRLSGLARGGDIEARNAIVEANLGLVGPVARSSLRRGTTGRLGLDDIWQEGRRGLIEAAESFDPDRGCAFSTHATSLIRHYIARARSADGALVVSSSRSRNDAARWRKLAAGGMGEREIARELGLCARGVERVKAALAAREACFHGDLEAWNEGLGHDPDADPAEMEDWLHEGLSRLDARDREALVLKYGIGGCEPVRGDGLARRLGVTRARVSQVAKRAQERLAALLAG